MHKAVSMSVREPLQDLVHDRPDLRLAEWALSLLHVVVHIAVHEFEHEPKLLFFANDFLELHNISMIELFKALRNKSYAHAGISIRR